MHRKTTIEGGIAHYIISCPSFMRRPQHFPTCGILVGFLHSRPIYGLTRQNASPSHDCSQWHTDTSTLAYRCGGSTGISPVSRLTGWRKPFRHLNAVCIITNIGNVELFLSLAVASGLTTYGLPATYFHLGNIGGCCRAAGFAAFIRLVKIRNKRG